MPAASALQPSDATDLGDLPGARDLARALVQLLHHGFHRHVGAALQVHRVHARGHRLAAFADDRLGKHGRRGRPVAHQIARLRGHLAQHLGAHVLELVGKLDLLGDGDPVLADARRAEGLVEHHVAPLGPQRHLDRFRQNIDPAEHAIARVPGKLDFLRRHFSFLQNSGKF